jgi:hypothetical protein
VDNSSYSLFDDPDFKKLIEGEENNDVENDMCFGTSPIVNYKEIEGIEDIINGLEQGWLSVGGKKEPLKPILDEDLYSNLTELQMLGGL